MIGSNPGRGERSRGRGIAQFGRPSSVRAVIIFRSASVARCRGSGLRGGKPRLSTRGYILVTPAGVGERFHEARPANALTERAGGRGQVSGDRSTRTGDESGLRVERIPIVARSRRRYRSPKSHRRERGNASEVRSHVRFRPFRPGIRLVFPGPEPECAWWDQAF